MRHILLALLITLLPLRGWLGDAMAVQTAQQLMHGTTSAEAVPHHGQTMAAGHCDEMPMLTPSHPEADGKLCHACDLCQSPALIESLVVPDCRRSAKTCPLDPGSQYVSAERMTGQKPPISRAS